MKDLLVLFKEALVFYKETLGHPDPARRTSPKTIVVVGFTITTMLFVYNFGAAIANKYTATSKTYEVLETENVDLRVNLNRLKRELSSCTVDREDLLDSYGELLRPPPKTELVTPIPVDPGFYDRLGELN